MIQQVARDAVRYVWSDCACASSVKTVVGDRKLFASRIGQTNGGMEKVMESFSKG